MSWGNFYFTVNDRQVSEELGRMFEGPGLPDLARFEAAMIANKAAATAATHAQTFSLRLSIKHDTRYRKDARRWNGRIVWGGESGWINNPVKYARAERARGGSHDFVREFRLSNPEQRYVDVIMSFLRNDP